MKKEQKNQLFEIDLDHIRLENSAIEHPINIIAEELEDNEPQEEIGNAEPVRTYNPSNLDDNFLGEYISTTDILEPNDYGNLIIDYLNEISLAASAAGDTILLSGALEQGANPTAINFEGKSCLDLAIENHHQDCVDIIQNFIKTYPN